MALGRAVIGDQRIEPDQEAGIGRNGLQKPVKRRSGQGGIKGQHAVIDRPIYLFPEFHQKAVLSHRRKDRKVAQRSHVRNGARSTPSS